MGQEYWQGYVAGGRVNAQAFSYFLYEHCKVKVFDFFILFADAFLPLEADY